MTRTRTVSFVLLIVTALGLTASTGFDHATANAGRTTVVPAHPPCPPAATAPALARTSTEKAQPHFPIRAAFYYGWASKSTHYHQTYGVDDVCIHTDAPHRTISEMRYAGIKAGIASWMGRGTGADKRIPALLRAADGTSFRWALYYEPAGQTIGEIAADLLYISHHYTRDRNYLRVNGKPVLFVWAGGANSCSLTHRWVSVNKNRYYLVLKTYYGWQRCHYESRASWHAYGPASRRLTAGAHAYSISPGFWPNSNSHPTLGRSTSAWASAIRSMIRSKAHWQLITTFNEWGENTAVESASEWATSSKMGRYLDLLHQYR